MRQHPGALGVLPLGLHDAEYQGHYDPLAERCQRGPRRTYPFRLTARNGGTSMRVGASFTT